MATAYSTLLGLALPVQGELSGTWGDTVNNYITNYLDAAVAGTQTASTDADITLTKTTGSALGTTSSQYAVILCSGARTAQRTITVPAASKLYAIINATTGGFGVKIVGAGPTTGVVVPSGYRAFVVWNGSDFSILSMVTTAGVVAAAYGGTGLTSFAVGDLLYADTTSSVNKLADVATGNALISGGVGVAPSYGKIGLTTHVSGTLAAGNGGTGQSSYAVGDILYADTASSVNKLADVATGNALISGGVGVAPSYGKIGLTTHISGTLAVANGGTGVTTSTGSGSVVLSTSPSLTTPVLGTPSSGTLTSCTGLPLTTGVTGTLPVANGGTGVTTSTGSGSNVLSTSPTLVTPVLGTPSSGTLTSCTGLPLTTGVTGTLPVANGGTGVTTSTGSGSNVLSTSPTLVTPVLGTPSSGTLTSCTGLPLTTGVTGTLPVANGGTGVTTSTGTGSTVLSTSPTLTTPVVDSLNGGQLAGLRNRIINGAMLIDQRNAGSSVTIPNGVGTYITDRFLGFASQASKFTMQQVANPATGSQFSKMLKVTSASAYSVLSTDRFFFQQHIEGFNVADLAWGTTNAATVTVSFFVYSSLTGTFGGSLKNYTGTRSYPFTFTVNSANTLEFKTITIAGDTTGTWATDSSGAIALTFGLGTGSTFSATAGAWAAGNYDSATGATSVVGTNGATFYITGVQLEKGSVATPFEQRPYGMELALCQRYYEILAQTMVGAASTGAFTTAKFQVAKRTNPTVVRIGNWITGNEAGTSISTITTTEFAITQAGSATSVGGIFTASAEL